MKNKIKAKKLLYKPNVHVAPDAISKLMIQFKQYQQPSLAFYQLAITVASLTHSSVQYVPTGGYTRQNLFTESRDNPCLCQ